MKVLVLGADGMLGHQVVASFRSRHDVIGTLRLARQAYESILPNLPPRAYFEVDVRNFSRVEQVLKKEMPDAVINCVGIVKQRNEAKDAIPSIEVNALLPHQLALSCATTRSRLIQISTDCVFSGRKGRYIEADYPDAEDLYGRTKLLGEVAEEGSITLRTSIIGLELSRRKSLVEWFLAQKGPIKGFRKAIYSGFTTLEMARIIQLVLESPMRMKGLYHVSSDPIDKFELLSTLKRFLGRQIEIQPDDDFICDRGMLSSRFREAFNYTPPSWDDMLRELAVQIKGRVADADER